MKIIPYTDIFELPKGNREAMTVTTNGIIKQNGCAVMGKGIAKSVNDRYNGISQKLAEHLKVHGNTPCDLGIYDGFHIISFPTKHHWKDPADIQLIQTSAKMIVKIADRLNLEKIYMTKPGCGCGQLTWEQVRPVIEPIFDDRFIIIN